MKIHELIKKYRLSRGLSQSEYGKELGISHAAISDIERGKTTHIPAKVVEHIMGFEICEYCNGSGLKEKSLNNALTTFNYGNCKQ